MVLECDDGVEKKQEREEKAIVEWGREWRARRRTLKGDSDSGRPMCLERVDGCH
jgi:hypothetical protein